MKSCTVVGLGYIGLPTSLIIAEQGIKVSGYDNNKIIVDNLNKGLIHIKEQNLENILIKTIKNKTFSAHHILKNSDVYIIAVPTPFKYGKTGIKVANLDFVMDAATQIAKVIKKDNLVIIESTCPVGTTERVADLIKAQSKLTLDEFNIAYCPERVIPGDIAQELIFNDRIIGGLSDKSSNLASEFYSKFCKGRFLKTNSKTAELAKLTENSYRDVNIAFSNEISLVCSKLNISELELIHLVNHHPRVNMLKPGCGVGGHCIAVDPWFLVSEALEITPLIQAARQVNTYKTKWVLNKIREKINSMKINLGKNKITLGCFGISYKADVDDLRESPALKITNTLIEEGFDILISEPNLKESKNFNLYDPEDVLENTDLAILLVNHSEFQKLNFLGKETLDFCGLTSNYE